MPIRNLKSVGRHAAANVEELQRALAEFVGDEHPSTVYLEDECRVVLLEETLSDGSKVYNIRIEPRMS